MPEVLIARWFYSADGKTFHSEETLREKSLYRFLVFRLAFPYNNDPPAILFELFSVLPVTLNIVPEFSAPVLGIGFWNRRSRTALVPVPETSMDKKSCSPAWEKQVWGTRQIFSVKAEPQSETVSSGTHSLFRRGVFRPDCPHILTAPFRRYAVCHFSIPYTISVFKFQSSEKTSQQAFLKTRSVHTYFNSGRRYRGFPPVRFQVISGTPFQGTLYVAHNFFQEL